MVAEGVCGYGQVRSWRCRSPFMDGNACAWCGRARLRVFIRVVLVVRALMMDLADMVTGHGVTLSSGVLAYRLVTLSECLGLFVRVIDL